MPQRQGAQRQVWPPIVQVQNLLEGQAEGSVHGCNHTTSLYPLHQRKAPVLAS